MLDEIGGTLGAVDLNEKIEDFHEIEPDELLLIAQHLSHIAPTTGSDNMDGHLRDWGEFRAVIHRAVWKALKE